MTQAETLRDIYGRLNALAEVACDPCDRCDLEIRRSIAFRFEAGLVSVNYYLEISPNLNWINQLNSQLDFLIAYVNSSFTLSSRQKIFKFLTKVFGSVSLSRVRGESPVSAYITALQLSYLFLFTDTSLTREVSKVFLDPQYGNQLISLSVDTTQILVKILEYPPSFGRFFTGFEPPHDFVVPNQFWLFFHSADLGGVLGFYQLQYRHQVFAVPPGSDTLFLQVPRLAKTQVVKISPR